MKQRTNRSFFAGTVVGATLALAGVVGAQSMENGDGAGDMMGGGMMNGGMMASMQKMMDRCNDMMAAMQHKQGPRSGEGSSGDAS